MAESGSKSQLDPAGKDGSRRRPSGAHGAIPSHVTRMRMPQRSLTGMQAESLKERQVS